MRRHVWLVTAVLVGCRVGDLVQTPPPAGVLRFSVQPSHADSGALIAPPVQVSVLDDARRPDTLYRHTVTISLIPNPGGAALSGATVASVVRGIATFPNLRLDRPGAGYVLRAEAAARPAAVSAAFDVVRASPPAATRLTFTVQPGATPAGTPITPAVRVAAQDAAGNVITTYEGIVTVALDTHASGAVLTGTSSVPANSGLATFPTLQVDSAGTQYTLTATASGLASVRSGPFTVSAPPPSQLVFTVQPANVRVSRRIEPPVQVLVLDAYGRPAVTFTGSVTIDLAPNAADAKVTGTATVNAVNGVATFSNLRVDRTGSAYQLRAAFAGQTPIALSIVFPVAS